MIPSAKLRVTHVRFRPAKERFVQTGLLGWISCDLGGDLLLDGIALRRTRTGYLTLSFPGRRDHRHRKHALVRPISDEARCEIERQVFEALGIFIDAPNQTTAHFHSDRRTVQE